MLLVTFGSNPINGAPVGGGGAAGAGGGAGTDGLIISIVLTVIGAGGGTAVLIRFDGLLPGHGTSPFNGSFAHIFA